MCWECQTSLCLAILIIGLLVEIIAQLDTSGWLTTFYTSPQMERLSSLHAHGVHHRWFWSCFENPLRKGMIDAWTRQRVLQYL